MLLVAGLGVLAPVPYSRVATLVGLAVLASASPWLALGLAAWGAWRSRPGPGIAVMLALGALVGLKQLAASLALPAAVGTVLVPPSAALSVAAAWLAEPHAGRRPLALLLVAAGALVAGQLGWAWAAPTSTERLVRAERIDAVHLFYGGILAEHDPALLGALVKAVPNRDEAALALGWERALSLGWRPQRAEGHAVEVARALEGAGRGGEAYRLLSRHQRTGEVDGFMSLMERVGGATVDWHQGQVGALVPGTIELDRELATNGEAVLEFTASGALGAGVLTLEGSSFEGPPRVTVHLDARPPLELAVDGAVDLPLGPLEPGPHRLRVRFDDDRVGAGGDRNVRVRRLVAR
ncbi:MAG: hypothetical protein FJ102_07375 [Deltaproteobacteria bacterium]|nr:hypothetical protein [Deltaproteobacteria bacterium]